MWPLRSVWPAQAPKPITDAVELIGRMVGAGLLERRPDGRDARLTRLHLTARGQRLVNELSEGHLPRLRELTRRGAELLRG